MPPFGFGPLPSLVFRLAAGCGTSLNGCGTLAGCLLPVFLAASLLAVSAVAWCMWAEAALPMAVLPARPLAALLRAALPMAALPMALAGLPIAAWAAAFAAFPMAAAAAMNAMTLSVGAGFPFTLVASSAPRWAPLIAPGELQYACHGCQRLRHGVCGMRDGQKPRWKAWSLRAHLLQEKMVFPHRSRRVLFGSVCHAPSPPRGEDYV